MKMIPLLISWGVIAALVILLAIYRKVVARGEDDTLHVDGNAVARQSELAQRLTTIDRWGKILTVIAAVTALGLLALFLYNGWMESNQINH